MKLTGNLKKIVYNAKTKEEARAAIEDAGMILSDEEMDKVSGGGVFLHKTICLCCGAPLIDSDEVGDFGYTKWKCSNPDCETNRPDPTSYISL